MTAPLAAIVRRMMAKKPEDRFQTPAAVAMSLTGFTRKSATGFIPIRRDALRAALASNEVKPLPDDTPMPGALRPPVKPAAAPRPSPQQGPAAPRT